MPTRLALFERLYYASLALGLVSSALQFDRLSKMAPVGFVILVQVLTLAVLVLMVWLVARRRKNWARWLMLILFIVGIPLAVPTILKTLQTDILSGGIGVVQIFLQLAALYCVFTGDAREWFQTSGTPSTIG
jgi:hypothetical protein